MSQRACRGRLIALGRRGDGRGSAPRPRAVARTALSLLLLTWAAASAAWAGERLAGNVLAVDAERGALTILDAGRRHEVLVAPTTAIRSGGENKTVSDLKRGDRVVITLADEDAGRAATIAIAGPGRLQSGQKAIGANSGFARGLNARSQPAYHQ